MPQIDLERAIQALISIDEVLVAVEEEAAGNLNDVADHALNAGIVADPVDIRVWIAAMRDRGSNFESIAWSLQESSRPAGVAGKPDGATGLQVFDENNRAVPVSKLLGERILKGKDKPIGLPQ